MKLQLTIASLALFVSSWAFPESSEWRSFKSQHGKIYENIGEEQTRMDIWLQHKAMIDEHNEKYERGEVSYTMAINEFSDLTTDEFAERFTGGESIETLAESSDDSYEGRDINEPEAPSSVDWRQTGAVTAVKNQGTCGSCYIFGAVASIEGQLKKASGQLMSLSEQQALDCLKSYGCRTGNSIEVFSYYYRAGGNQTESYYPYKNRDNLGCHYVRRYAVAAIGGYQNVAANENALRDAVASIGPIAVQIQFVDSFRHYSGGVYDDPSCNSGKFTHIVAAIGYGNERLRDYWLIKNSWGPQWGDKGYIKMVRNKNGQCGIAKTANYPTGVRLIRRNEITARQSSVKYFLSLLITNV